MLNKLGIARESKISLPSIIFILVRTVKKKVENNWDLDELKVKLIAEGDEGKEVEAELRADYTIEELNELVIYASRIRIVLTLLGFSPLAKVHYVKGMTTLSGLAKKDWTYQCHVIIREFFENPKHRVLCIYYEVTNKVPMALLSFPLTPVYELCYFIRKPDQIFRLENFHDTIVFGSFNWSVEYYILNVVQSVLTPIIFKIETLPDIANSVGEQARADGSSCGSFSRLASHDAKGDHVDTRTALASA
ncbi:dynein axonemal heavy chain 2-like [Vespula maculifrons]|uniref:Dynein axonemal heavy chain 2-like n=1 Tax=Vespula maculifrons TaxID=7453 RepID=A0ABD2BC98_VESMC